MRIDKLKQKHKKKRNKENMIELKNQVSYDHRSYECNLDNCVLKPEKVRTSTGFEPVTSRYRCDALTS